MEIDHFEGESMHYQEQWPSYLSQTDVETLSWTNNTELKR